jgi:hypothetical protein
MGNLYNVIPIFRKRSSSASEKRKLGMKKEFKLTHKYSVLFIPKNLPYWKNQSVL